MKQKELKLKCECLSGRSCDRLLIYDLCDDWVEVNVQTIIKGRRKTVGGVVVNKKDLIDFCKQ